MDRRTFIQIACAQLSSLPWATKAESYPSRPIRFLIGFPAGGPTDVTMRLLAENAGNTLGQPVIVENKPGAAATLPAQALQTAPPDGYTLAQIPLGVFRLPYTTRIHWDPVKDIRYVINLTGYEFGVVVPADGPIKTWSDFVAYARAHPRQLSYASTGSLTTPHLTMERIARRLGLQLNHIPYKGSPDLQQALLGGHVMAGADTTGFAPLVEAGKLRVLNTWGDKRLDRFADTPTLMELGLDLVQKSPFGIGVHRDTAATVVQTLHDAFKKAMESRDFVNALKRYDMVPIYMDSQQYTKFAQDTFAAEKALIEHLGLARPN
jgi:tripartite-type tricarboxylate transporter receptor subunit TctC